MLFKCITKIVTCYVYLLYVQDSFQKKKKNAKYLIYSSKCEHHD